MSSNLSHSRLLEVLDYDASTGVFRWRVATSNRVKVGSVAGAFNKYGYVVIRVDGRLYRAHRLAWFYTHGVWPCGEIDHVDMVKDNNRLANLRDTTRTFNNANVPARKHNALGVKGVSYDPLRGKYFACLSVNGRSVLKKRFNTIEEAEAAYAASASEHHGQFARTK